MNYMKIVPCDIANGPGVRVTLFCAGCSHHCPGCHNPQTWSPDAGQPFTDKTLDELIELLRPDYIQGLTLTGGDPLYPENREVMARILKRAQKEFTNTKDYWAWTGFTWEELVHQTDAFGVLAHIDVLVDGPFVEEQKDISLPYMGSKNQRVINVTRSLYGSYVRTTNPYLWWAPEEKKGNENG